MKLLLLNTAIITVPGRYVIQEITTAAAIRWANDAFYNGGQAYGYDGVLSAIGHTATADIMTSILGIPVTVNRIQAKQEVMQDALVFKLRGRLPEGQILSKETIEEIGYDFWLMSRERDMGWPVEPI